MPSLAPFTSAALTAALRTRWVGRQNVVLADCASTNDLAALQARGGAGEGLVIVADRQSGGRGRMGRAWHSPAGENLYFSILLRPTRPAVEIPPLTLLAGAALALALTTFDMAPRLKWPNDVQLTVTDAASPRKVAGILTEMATEGAHVAHVVVGIGLNVNTREFPSDLADKATSLVLARAAAGGDDRPLDRLTVLAAVLAAFEDAYEKFRADGPRAAVALWNPHAALGARCRVRVEGREVDGVSLGIDADGALRVRDDDGRVHHVVSGEVT
ncbi:MAG TPA: biotin--[acetyl-CoA-carboxylase] ligase [Polyangia bacterium]|nr:biotin--[acetyl-CoA-carboxylase] ligase [Polyangia bacterium]